MRPPLAKNTAMAACIALLFGACAQGAIGEGPKDREPSGSEPSDPPDPDDDGPVNPTDDDPTPEPDPDPPPPDCTPQTINLLANPNFDDGPDVGWLKNDTGTLELIVTGAATGVPTQTPEHAAWLGGINNSVHAVMQPIAVPSDATNLVIRGHRSIVSEDGDVDADKLRIRLTDTDFNVLELLSDPAVACQDCTYSNTSGTTAGAYVSFALPTTGNHAGTTLYVHAQSNLDSGLLTDFVLDTFAAEVTACPPTP